MTPHVDRRWQEWQMTPVSQKLLSAEARQQGYTVSRVPPASREAFLDTMALLLLYGRLRSHQPPIEDLDEAWQAWLTHTRRLTGYLKRRAAGQEGTPPTMTASLLPCDVDS